MNRKFVTIIAICGTALSPIASTAAFAAVTLVDAVPAADAASQETLDAMQDACDAQAATHDTGNGDIWTGVVVTGAVTLQAGPTETGSHGIDDAITGTLMPAAGATFTPNDPHIVGDPYRNGGSVNMFGTQASGGGHWSASQYDFYGEFETTYRHNFSCKIYQAVFHPETLNNGHYEIDPDYKGNEENAVLAECSSYNKRGQRLPLPGYWGKSPQGNCVFVAGESIPEYWDPDVLITTVTGLYVDQTQDDTLKAHESAGEGYDTTDDIQRQVVVCISPSSTGKKLPGDWVKKNGYTGDKCTRAWYDTGATVGVTNLQLDSHNWVTIPTT